MRFNEQEDLRKFLEDLGELYVPYCGGLWDLGPVRSTEDLAVAPEADLQRCGVQSGIHIARIKAVASGAASSNQAGAGVGAATGTCVYDSPKLQEDLRWLTKHLGTVYRTLNHSAEDQYISFGNKNLHAAIPRDLCSSLYVRPLYWKLLQVLEDMPKRDASVVTGNPGVGKSAFAILLIAFLAHKKLPVIYRHKARQQETLLLMDFRQEPFKHRMASYDSGLQRKWELEHPGVWVIWDGTAPTGQHDKAVRVVVLSSPTEQTWNELLKRSSGNTALWLDTWSLTELLACARLKAEREDFLVEAGDVSERFRLFGGIPRYVLEQASATVEDAMQKFKQGDIQDLINTHRIGSETTVSHRLVQARADANFHFLYYQLASPTIMRRVAEKIKVRNEDSMLNFIRQATGDSTMSVLRGLMFEQHGHSALPTGPGVWMRQLQRPEQVSQPAPHHKRPRVADEGEEEEEEEKDGGEEEDAAGAEEEVDLSGPVSHHFANIHEEQAYDVAGSSVGSMQSLQHSMQQLSIEGASHVKLQSVEHMWDSATLGLCGLDRVYVQPPTTNNPSLDAFYKHSGCGAVLLLQYTVSKRHATWATPVVSFLQRLRREDQQLARMVFVVPGDNLEQFKAFQYQKWLGKTGKVLKTVPKPLKELQQWVVALPLHGSRPSTATASM